MYLNNILIYTKGPGQAHVEAVRWVREQHPAHQPRHLITDLRMTSFAAKKAGSTKLLCIRDAYADWIFEAGRIKGLKNSNEKQKLLMKLDGKADRI